eukprot:TRINITY_DN6997_c0_g2_i1.p1 TRINITY_DN6997_c0_g2~~TRINITY_DN6997_c0_g2_i1.p1  ORF type:complete len:110 (-),score=15.31 TRINITY_DN6997_c0_g2_i1:281-610(-)
MNHLVLPRPSLPMGKVLFPVDSSNPTTASSLPYYDIRKIYVPCFYLAASVRSLRICRLQHEFCFQIPELNVSSSVLPCCVQPESPAKKKIEGWFSSTSKLKMGFPQTQE